METIPKNSDMQNLLISDIVRYLHHKTWQPGKPYKKGIQVFQGPLALSGNPLEIVLPTDERAHDRETYIRSALNLLSALNEQTTEEMVEQIHGYERDILYIRNIYSGAHGTISLNLAATQIPSIKHLLVYAACSEDKHPRPYYQRVTDYGAKIGRSFEFAHTSRKSFGFTIESVVGDQEELSFVPNPHASSPELLDMQKYTIPPVERRVMERLIRGLLSLKQALIHNDPLFIVREYSSGLNANMCRSILNMSDRHKIALEYNIQWSPKIQPSSDIADYEPIVLDTDAYLYLSKAAEELKRFPFHEISIIGNVTGLISKDDPMGSVATPRHVMIKGLKRDGSSINVAVMLSIEDYVVAHDAHLNWRFIEISGELTRMGNSWQLSNYRDFHVLSNQSVTLPLI